MNPRLSINTRSSRSDQRPSHVRSSSSQLYALPAADVPGELQELRSLVELTKARVGNLEALLDPPALTHITETKRLMRDAHRNLERLRSRVSEPESIALVRDVTVESWQLYQRLVKVEEKLRRAVTDISSTETQSAALAPQVSTGAYNKKQHSREGSGRVSFALNPTPVIEEMDVEEEAIQSSSWTNTRFCTWPDTDKWEEDQGHLTEGEQSPRANSAPLTPIDSEPQMPSFYRPSYGGRVAERTDTVSTSDTTSSEDLSGLSAFPVPPDGSYSETGSGAFGGDIAPVSHPGLQALSFEHGFEAPSSRMAPKREEVERRCAREETFTTIGLYDPDGKREGSIPGFHVTYAILAGVDDPNHCLPRLRFIKIHELRRLKEWLVQRHHLNRCSEISRTEMVLHLIFILQEGWRMETVAVLFSRTPRQVYGSCHGVFDRLREMYQETSLKSDQPACPQLWKIAPKFMDGAESRRWERYYHWKKQDVFHVLMALNLYIGRYRQQGQVALDGPYQYWWRYFARSEASEWMRS